MTQGQGRWVLPFWIVARVIVSKFPELKVYLTQDRAWKERYHQNMFDAVALGMMVTMPLKY